MLFFASAIDNYTLECTTAVSESRLAFLLRLGVAGSLVRCAVLSSAEFLSAAKQGSRVFSAPFVSANNDVGSEVRFRLAKAVEESKFV
jgi:hypothetical protein